MYNVVLKNVEFVKKERRKIRILFYTTGFLNPCCFGVPQIQNNLKFKPPKSRSNLI